MLNGVTQWLFAYFLEMNNIMNILHISYSKMKQIIENK